MRIGQIAILFAALTLCSTSVLARSSVAAGDASADVRLGIPPQLAPWVDWVLYDSPDIRCPSVDGVRHCIWPGDLAVTVNVKGATFAYDVFVDRKTTVLLPGNKDFWPQNVDVDGGYGVVTREGEAPAVLLSAGQHRVTGQFRWATTPEVIAVPDDVARVSLKILDESVDFPRVEQGKLWLGKSGVGEESAADSVRATVYRRFEDGVPLHVSTRVQLNVSGRAREVSLGKILFEKSVPTQVRSTLPVQLPPEGDISVYVRPGSHEIFIDAVIPMVAENVIVPSPSPNFYESQEVWVWVPDENIRSVRIEGVTPTDPERTSLPSDWHGHATYVVEHGAKMAIKQSRRGMAEPAPNMINLSRELWLDLDGEGYTVRDNIRGEMNQGWRINHGTSATLGRVYDNAESADLLITQVPGKPVSGVEIRRPQLDLTAELRLEKVRAAIPIVGWTHDMQSLSASLHLPPGWTLVGGRGVDRMPGTWLESWTLFDFFFVLMVALTLGKLFGWGWAPVTLLALCLTHGHDDAPEWIWIGLLVSLALVRVVPQGWIRKGIVVVRAVMLIGLVVVLAPYARDQIRHALHPQVASPDSFGHPGASFATFGAKGESAPMAPAPELMEGAPEEEWDQRAGGAMDSEDGAIAMKSVLSRKVPMAKKPQPIAYQQLQQIDPNAVVQTGPGLPNWSWSNWSLNWTGPVRQDHTIELWMISPTLNRVLAVVRVILLILLGLLMFAPRDTYWNVRPVFRPTLAARLLGLATVLLALGAPLRAGAEEPMIQQEWQNNVGNFNTSALGHNPGMLDQLKARLEQDSLCNGPCAVASRATIEIDGVNLKMVAEVHTEKLTGWNLPGPSDPLRIDEVLVDGRPTEELRRDASGLAMVRLTPGRHQVELRGRLVNRNVVTLQFRADTRPQFVEFKSSDWSVDGIGPDGVPDNSLQLTKRMESGAEDTALSTDLPPWFQVERRVELGMPWRIRTIVTRIDDSRPQLLKLPLTNGESVLSEETRMESGRALVDFPRGASRIEFLSEIPITPTVDLEAVKGEPFTETWYVQCSRIWRCDFSELPRIADVTDGVYQPMWKPWPGEKLKVTVVRPQGAPGQAVTVDSVDYTITPGKRLLQAELCLTLRASQGGMHDITLPEGAELQRVTVDGETRALRPKDRVVTLPVKPGSQRFEITWQQPWERSTHELAPTVKIGSNAVNVATVMNLGEDRWLLWTHGPQWGPAILFWSHLAILLVMAVLLGRIRNLPVRTWEWLLLVIGLSQLPVIAGLPIVVWFVLVSWRGRSTKTEWWKFDLAQLSILALTFASLSVLYAAIHFNLLVDIDMQVQGANSSNGTLRWYVDQTGPDLAAPGIVSLPILAFRIAMLLWAFWLVSRLIKWARWGWGEFSRDGFWRDYPKPTPKPRKGPASPPPTPAPAAPVAPAADGTTEPASTQETASTEATSQASTDAAPEPIKKRRASTTIPGAPVPEAPASGEPSEPKE